MRLVGFFFFFLVSAGWSQLSVQEPRPVYEGQNVAAIDLIGNPHRDVEPLRTLISQKTGQPYSQANVEASIAALRDTGQFPKVAVNVVPAPSGLRLNFLLEPAFYLGIVKFSGLSKAFSYTRLLQVVNLSEEDPYDLARIPEAQQALQNFLQKNGYFQAKITTSSEIDDPHQLVNVTFSAEIGKQARISGVTFQGPEPNEDAKLLHAVRSLRARFTGGLLKNGKAYTAERLIAATTLIRRTLAQQHRLSSKVEELQPQFNAANNRVEVSFKIDLGPIVYVRTTGVRLSFLPFLSDRQLKKLIPIYSEGTIDRDLVEEGQRNLVDYLQKKGYFDAKVKINFQRKPEQILLVYEVDKGKRHKVDGIVFRGNHAIAEKELLPQVVVKKARLLSRGSANQKLMKQSATNLIALYHDRGYEDVKVTAQTVDHEPKVGVVFNIEEGPQTLVNSVAVTGNDNLPEKDIAAPSGFQLKTGSPLSPRLLSQDRNRISANYLNRGYLNVQVRASVTREPTDPHRVNIQYAVTEHQLIRVGEVVYIGQQHTRMSLLRKTAKIPAEAPMKRGDLLAAESQLYDLNIFDWSSVGPRKPITDQTEESAVVKVHEAKRNEITYGFGFEVSHRGGNIPSGTVAVPGLPPVQLGNNQIAPSQSTFASPRGSIAFNRRNVRGLGETASASILLSRLDQRAALSYAQPHFFGSQWTSLGTFSLERSSENPLFSASLGDLSYQVERLISRKSNTRLQVRYDFNKTVLSHLLVSELVLPQDRNVHLSTFSGALVQDTRDKPLDAHHGVFGTLNLGITPSAFGSSANFAKLFGQYAYYKPVHSVVFANSIRLGLAKSFANSFVPTSQLFFSGGGTSLRGFPIDQAGPQRLVPFCDVLQGQSSCVNVTVPVGGRQLFILNSEARFPLGIMKALGGVLFYDGGNVNSAISFRSFADNYTNTIGVGLRYATPIGPVRIDLGKNVNPVTGIKSTQYYITLGQAF